MENDQRICEDNLPLVLKMKAELESMVYPWMCSPDCSCYAGDGNSTKTKWEEYGNEVLFPYYRNNDTLNMRNEDDTAMTVPFSWNYDSEAEGTTHTFVECYEQTLSNYTTKLNDHDGGGREAFYDNGTYEFIVKLEEELPDCSGVCLVPLFYLTKDVS